MVRVMDRQKFVHLAEARVNKALKDIQLIGNLSNRSNYDYTEEDVERIFKALSGEISACKKRFELSKRKNSGAGFTLEAR
jgi:RNA recognition motif-containing protein